MNKIKNHHFSLFLFILMAIISCEKNEGMELPAAKELTAAEIPRKKVLYVDSYNIDYPWIRDLMESMLGEFSIEMDENGGFDGSEGLVALKVFHMDTKNNKDRDYIIAAAQRARTIIEEWQPDVVIASDDNASKYLIAPYYRGSSLPVVFCGINGDSSVYGFPAENITGMEEFKLVDQLIEELTRFARGDKAGILMADNLSAHREVEEFEKLLGYPLTKEFARSYKEWERLFITMQQDLDILLIGALDGLSGWDHDLSLLGNFVENETRIPTGSWLDWLNGIVLITLAEKASEMGEWAASAALKILNGTSPSEIPVVRNKQASVYLNMALAKKLNVIFPQDIIDRSHLVNRVGSYDH